MTDLDHVAIATTDPGATLGALVGELGGTIFHGGDGSGFRWVQVRLGEAGAGMTVEVLVEWEPEQNDFLARFIARHGERQHHLTFKVDDIEATLQRVRAAGFRPVGVALGDPEWKEAFLQPREAHGTVVQLAQVSDDHPRTPEMVTMADAGETFFEPEWWPAPPARAHARWRLRRVVLATPSLPAAVGFFAGILDGTVVDDGPDAVELEWKSGGRVRLEQAADVAPGVVRLEGSGIPVDRVISGTRFVTA